MFEYEFFDDAAFEHRPEIQFTPPSDRITFDDLASIRPTHWGEHCVECAMPLCFGTCVHYEARPDGKCRRFDYGIRNADDHAFAAFPYHAEIQFRNWGKLESPIHPGTIAPAKGLEQEAAYLEAANAVRSAFIDGALSNPAGTWATLLHMGYSTAAEAIADEDLGAKTDWFVFQAYSLNENAFDLSLEVTTLERLVGKATMHIEPGFNEFAIPLQISAPPLRNLAFSNERLLARLVPYDDFPAHMVILMAEFANMKAGRLPVDGKPHAAQPKAKAIPDKPAEKVKCVCWDLDNTIWDGTLIESDPESLELRPGIWDALNELDRRGIVQMVVSKNQEEDVLPVMKRLGIDHLFVYKLINWNAKSENISHIADMLNINLDTFAFVDDQPFERAEVGENLPCVRVYPETDVSEMLNASPFDVPVTQDGSKRRIMYQTEAERLMTQERFSGSNADFVRTCNLSMEIGIPTSPAQINRAFELVQRTNQLNLSGKRYEKDEFQKIMSSTQGKRTVCISCSDRFGSYGQIGHAVLELKGAVLYVRECAISCRVMGKYVENALVGWLMEMAERVGAEWVVLKGRRTERNALMEKTFRQVGFADASLFKSDIVLEARRTDRPLYSDIVSVTDNASATLEKSLIESGNVKPGELTEAIAVSPHQDDEVLTLGAGIVEALDRYDGRVAVVLVSDGANCATRLRLADSGSCDDIHDEHKYSFDAATYGRLRDKEFIAACESMGVEPSAVVLASPRAIDGNVSASEARACLERLIRAYPNAAILTHAVIEPDMTPHPIGEIEKNPRRIAEHVRLNGNGTFLYAPQHPDHRACGQAALALFTEGLISRLELFVEPYHVIQFQSMHPDTPLVFHPLAGMAATSLTRAVQEYCLWNPTENRYALGFHSARQELKFLGRYPHGWSLVPKTPDDILGGQMEKLHATQRSALDFFDRSQCLDDSPDISSDAQAELDSIKRSTTFRVGRIVMAIPCALKRKLDNHS